MNIATRWLCVAILFSINGFSGAYQEQQRLIDQHLENPTANIDAMIAYTLDSLRHDENLNAIAAHLPAIKNLKFLGDISDRVEGYETLPQAQKIFLHCYAALHLKDLAEQSNEERIITTAKLCSAMLSKDVFLEDGLRLIFTHEYPLIRDQRDFLTSLVEIKNYDERIKFITFLKFMAPSSITLVRETEPLPLVLLPPHCVFELKTFLYALSRGVTLFGLDSDRFDGHGGVFAPPVLAIAHDKGHSQELGDGNDLATLKLFASGLLKLIDQNFFGAETDKAIYAAFVMLHETQIKNFVCGNPMEAMSKRLAILFDCVKQRFGEQEYAKYSLEFSRAFYSDIALEIVKVQPELKDTVFPSGERNEYDLAATIEAHVKLVNWLRRKMVESHEMKLLKSVEDIFFSQE